MRQIIHLLFAGTLAFAASCSTKTACITPTITWFAVNSADSIPDTSAVFYEYTKNSNFGTLVDSSGMTALYIDDAPLNQKQANFPDLGMDSYEYDWIIILYPSGKTYKLTNITHDNNSMKTYGEITSFCVNNIHYTINSISYNSALSSATSSSSISLFIATTY